MNLNDINKLQIEEIEKHKWIESEKAGYDLGENSVVDWIHRYAGKFRKEIEELVGEKKTR